MTAKRPSTILDSLPKAELHLHLEGTIRPDTALELAASHGEELTLDEVATRYRYHDFTGFLETFKWVTSFLRQPEDYALITRRMCEELVSQNVVYAEVTISTGVMLRRTQDVEANFEAIREAALGVLYNRLHTQWIFDAVRQFGADAAMEVARCAAKLQAHGVIGFGMGGDELAIPTASFRPVYDYARSEGLHLLCHAGEIGGPAMVREAVEILGVERVGHGIATMHDEALGEALARRHIALENCLTSNLCTSALAKQIDKPVAQLADHPLKAFIEKNWPVVLSTDDPGLFHTDLQTEYALAESLGLSQTQLLRLAEESYRSAFLPPKGRRQLLANFQAAARSAALL